MVLFHCKNFAHANSNEYTLTATVPVAYNFSLSWNQKSEPKEGECTWLNRNTDPYNRQNSISRIFSSSATGADHRKLEPFLPTPRT